MLSVSTESDCLTAYTGLDAVFSLAVLPNRNLFVCGSHDGGIKGFRLDTGDTVLELCEHTSTVRALCADENVAGAATQRQEEESAPSLDASMTAFARLKLQKSPTAGPTKPQRLGTRGQRLFSCSTDGTAKLWDLVSGDCIFTFRGHRGSVNTLLLHDEDDALITGGEDGCLKYWSLKTGECLRTVRVHIGGIEAIVLGGQNLVYTASTDSLCKCIDIEKGALMAVYEGVAPVRCLTYVVQSVDPTIPVPKGEVPHGPLLYCGCSDGRIRAFDTSTAQCVKTLSGHTEVVFDIKVRNEALFSCADDGTLRQWHLPSASCDYIYRGHTDAVRCIELQSTDPRGSLYTGSFDKTVRLWDREGVETKIRITKLLSSNATDGIPGVKPLSHQIFKANVPRPPSGRSGSKGNAKRPASAKGKRPSSAKEKEKEKTAAAAASRRPATAGSMGRGRGEKIPNRAAWERDLEPFNENNLSGVHKVFLRFTPDNGQLTWEEFCRTLQFLGVTAIPLAHKVFTSIAVKGMLHYKVFIRAVEDAINGANKEMAIKSSFLLWDVNRTGMILRRDVLNSGTLAPELAAHRLGRNDLQIKCLMEFFDPQEEKTSLLLDEFAEAMGSRYRMVQAFLTPILMHLPGVM